MRRCSNPLLALIAGIVTVTSPLASRHAFAAEIDLHASAVDAALLREVYNRDRKLVLSGDPRTCTFAVLDSPASSFRDGRLYLRTRFSGQAGVPVNNQCVGQVDSFWVTVSAVPYAKSEIVGLQGVRVEEAKNAYRPLIELIVTAGVAKAVNINLREEVMKMFAGANSPYKISVPHIDVQSMSTEGNALRVRFDFKLEAR